MKRKRNLLLLTPLLLVSLASCNSNDGPREGEDINKALNKRNFVAYLVQSNHFDEVFNKEVYAQALLTLGDMKFVTKTKELFTSNELSYYYFKNKHDGSNSYDIYYKEKTNRESRYLGNSYYEGYRFRLGDTFNNIPNLDTLKTYYNAYDVSVLEADDFTYDNNRGGWYELNEDAYDKVISNFFELDETKYELEVFDIQIEEDHVNSIVYKVSGSEDGEDVVLENELIYRYSTVDLYLDEPQYSLINNVEIKEYVPEVIEEPDIPSSEDTTEEPGSEEPKDEPSSEDLTTEEDTTESTEVLPLLDLEEETEEPIEEDIKEILTFSLYEDYNLFLKADAKNVISEINLYHNFDLDSEENEIITSLVSEDLKTIRDRSLKILDKPLIHGDRYLLRVTLSTGEHYDYNFIR